MKGIWTELRPTAAVRSPFVWLLLASARLYEWKKLALSTLNLAGNGHRTGALTACRLSRSAARAAKAVKRFPLALVKAPGVKMTTKRVLPALPDPAKATLMLMSASN